MQIRTDQIKKNGCGCGRSPTGRCCGWHGLTEEAYQQRRAEHEDIRMQIQRQEELERYREQAISLWFDNSGNCTGTDRHGTPNIN